MDFSFVIPCYRSQNTILKVVDEIENTMMMRPELSYEIILVNDYSPDDVWNVIKERVKNDLHVIGICLAKNFGQHCALMAGYKHTSGDIVVSLDDDGQTPASEVFKLVEKLNEGYDVVYASYSVSKQSLFRRIGSNFANKMNNAIFDLKNDTPNGSSYYIMKRFVVDEIIKYDHSYTYIAGLVLRATRNIGYVPIEQRERYEGKSGYSLKGLISLWLNGFTAFSVKPLMLSSILGIFSLIIAFLMIILIIVRKMIWGDPVAGWPSMVCIIVFIGGLQLFSVGILGQYLAKIYTETKDRPLYIVREEV